MLRNGFDRIKSHWLIQVIFWARWLITLVGFLCTLLWYAYVEGQDISENLSKDYRAVQNAQSTLINDSLGLHRDLLNPNVKVNLHAELSELGDLAKLTIGALGGLRAPTSEIKAAQVNYRTALEGLIAVVNRLERGETKGMATSLHNRLQSVANVGGDLNEAVGKFQGGMWPQLIGSIL